MPPAWLISLVIKYGLTPLVMAILRKLGLVNWAEAFAAQVAASIIKDVQGIKTYSSPSDYPIDKSGM